MNYALVKSRQQFQTGRIPASSHRRPHMRRALNQKHGFTGSVHALYRFLKHEVAPTPQATIKLEFAVGE
jgi:ribosomal protein L20